MSLTSNSKEENLGLYVMSNVHGPWLGRGYINTSCRPNYRHNDYNIFASFKYFMFNYNMDYIHQGT